MEEGFWRLVGEEGGMGMRSVRCYWFGMEEGWGVGIDDVAGEGHPSQPVSLSTPIPRSSSPRSPVPASACASVQDPVSCLVAAAGRTLPSYYSAVLPGEDGRALGWAVCRLG